MVDKYEVIDHGVDHAQYFQGCGVANTEFTHVATGAGDSAKDAAMDAREQFYNVADLSKLTVAEAVALDAEIESLPEAADAHKGCDEVGKVDHDCCEMNHYVSIRWKE